MSKHQENGVHLAISENTTPLDPPHISIWELLNEGFKANPHGPAVISLYQSPDHLTDLVGPPDSSVDDAKYLSWSYTTLRQAALRVAHALSAQGVRPGDKIVVFLVNCAEWALMMWATARLGATFVPMDKRILERAEEMEYYLRILSPKVLIVEDAVGAKQAMSHKLQDMERVPIKITVRPSDGSADLPQWQDLTQLVRQFETETASRSQLPTVKDLPRDDETASILFTSGTTSRPKGCLRTVRNNVAQTMQLIVRSNFVTSSRQMLQYASFRGICNAVTLNTWNAGASIIFPCEFFDAGIVADALAPLGITHMSVVPAQLHDFAELQSRFTALNTMEKISMGGDVVTRDMLDRASKLFNGAQPLPIFGMTEGSGGAMWLPGEEITSTAGGIVGLGRPQAGSKVKVCEPGTRQVLKCGELGALHLSSLATVRGYLEGRDAEMFYEDEEGRSWFITGDQAMIDDDGVLFVLGRYKDIIKVAAVGLSPAVLEACLNKVPGIQATVLGMPHKVNGSMPVAVLNQFELDPKTKRELEERVVNEVGFEAELGAVVTLKDLGLKEMPLNATGKVMRSDLKASLENYFGR